MVQSACYGGPMLLADRLDASRETSPASVRRENSAQPNRPGLAMASILPLALGVTVLGCTDSGGLRGLAPLPTAIVVDPLDVLGDLDCSSSEGGIRAYQVTLFDVTDDLPGSAVNGDTFELPTSSVISCTQPVEFRFVVPGHRYVADVALFTRDDLTAPAPGFPAAVDDDGRTVPPAYTTHCYGTRQALAAAGGGEVPASVGGLGGQGGSNVGGSEPGGSETGGSEPGGGDAGGFGGTSVAGQAGGASTIPLGAEALLEARIFMRGCEPPAVTNP